MTVFRDPRAPAGRVVLGGHEFIDGVTADIDPSAGVRRLFKGAGVIEEPAPAATEAPQLSPKEALQVEAASLGLDTDGTKAEIQARIDEHRTALAADDTEE
ncbi:SAP domain-containing protein [Leucobacter sp.]